MKSNIIIIPIVILGFLMLGMMVTNPSLEDHRREALELLKKTVESDEASSSTDFKSQKKNVINLLLGTRIINTKINRTNLVLFSLTTLKTDEDNKIVGFGIFGSVILFKKTSYQLEWQIDQQNDESEKGNTKTSIKSKKIDVTDDKVQNENNIEQSNAYYSLGYYRPIAIDSKRVYFHNLPNYSTRRKAYLVPQDIVYVEKIQNGFGYVRFTNYKGQVTEGWLDMSELVPN